MFSEEVSLGKTHVQSGKDGLFRAEIVMPFLRRIAGILQKGIRFPVVQDRRN